MIFNYFLSLADKAAILDFTNNALSKVLSGYTTSSGPKTLWEKQKSWICVYSVEYDFNLLFDLE